MRAHWLSDDAAETSLAGVWNGRKSLMNFRCKWRQGSGNGCFRLALNRFLKISNGTPSMGYKIDGLSIQFPKIPPFADCEKEVHATFQRCMIFLLSSLYCKSRTTGRKNTPLSLSWHWEKKRIRARMFAGEKNPFVGITGMFFLRNHFLSQGLFLRFIYSYFFLLLFARSQ